MRSREGLKSRGLWNWASRADKNAYNRLVHLAMLADDFPLSWQTYYDRLLCEVVVDGYGFLVETKCFCFFNHAFNILEYQLPGQPRTLSIQFMQALALSATCLSALDKILFDEVEVGIHPTPPPYDFGIAIKVPDVETTIRRDDLLCHGQVDRVVKVLVLAVVEGFWKRREIGIA